MRKQSHENWHEYLKTLVGKRIKKAYFIANQTFVLEVEGGDRIKITPETPTPPARYLHMNIFKLFKIKKEKVKFT